MTMVRVLAPCHLCRTGGSPTLMGPMAVQPVRTVLRNATSLVGEATRDVWGVDPHHQRLVAFGVEQWMEMLSPSNLAMLNPVVIRKSLDENGANLARGLSNLFDDIARRMANQPRPGRRILS